MNNDFENNNGTAPGENSAGTTPPTEENTTYHYAYKPAGGTGQNPQPGSGFDSAQGNGASAANQGANAGPYANANAGASNPQGGYNYSQGGSYYTPPQQQAWQPQGEPPKKEKKHRQKKAKAVKLDENGNPIPQKKNKTTMIICIVIAICAAIAVVEIKSLLRKDNSHCRKTHRLFSMISVMPVIVQVPLVNGGLAISVPRGTLTNRESISFMDIIASCWHTAIIPIICGTTING